MAVRLAGAGVRTYPLNRATCTDGGFHADAADGSGASIDVASGRAAVVIAGQAPIHLDVAATRNADRWIADGQSLQLQAAIAVVAICT